MSGIVLKDFCSLSLNVAHWFQILEEMEREFGISCPKDLPNEERQQNQRDILDLHKHRDRRRTSQSHRRELDGAQSGGEEKSKQQEKVRLTQG